VNPFLEYERASNDKRDRDDLLHKQKSNRQTTTDSDDSAVEDSPFIEAEHNVISFGQWFLFCQHCRHGGHANCIDQWFGGSGRVVGLNNSLETDFYNVKEGNNSSNDDEARKRFVCGVNGCDCRCILRV